MPYLYQQACKNLILTAISPEDYSRLEPHFEDVALCRGSILVRANSPASHVYFPQDGVVSIVSEYADKWPTEVGLFGLDGMSAAFLLLGAPDTPHQSVVQISGVHALRIETALFLQVVARSETLRATLLRYVQVLMIQTAQSTVAIAHQLIEARIARWLLMCHDRVRADEIVVTHEIMSTMITAQRSGVTIGIHSLEGKGLIRSSRGRIFILDRAALLLLAGEGYGMPETQFSKLLVPFGK